MKLQDTLCTEAEMLFAPNDGIVVDEPNLQAQPQCPETLARLVGYEWGLHATNQSLVRICPAQGWEPEVGMEEWTLALKGKSAADQGTIVGFVFKPLYIQGAF